MGGGGPALSGRRAPPSGSGQDRPGLAPRPGGGRRLGHRSPGWLYPRDVGTMSAAGCGRDAIGAGCYTQSRMAERGPDGILGADRVTTATRHGGGGESRARVALTLSDSELNGLESSLSSLMAAGRTFASITWAGSSWTPGVSRAPGSASPSTAVGAGGLRLLACYMGQWPYVRVAPRSASR